MKKLIDFFSFKEENEINQFKETIPFFLFAILVLAWLYFQEINNSLSIDEPARFIPFTLLYIIHLALYLLLFYIIQFNRGPVLYMVLQGILAFVIVWISGSITLAIGLYCALIGNIVGMLGKTRQAVGGVVGYLALMVFNFLILNDIVSLQEWLSIFLPAVGFAAFFAYFLSRQMEGREKDRKLLKEVEIANKQLAENSAQIESLTLTNERQRMARELHDTLAQGLAGLILQLEAADHHIQTGNIEKSSEIVQKAMTRARGTLVDARRAIDDLRIAMPYTSSFTEAILKEVDHFKDATGIPCEINIDLHKEINETLSEHLFRAISECLTNIARHARATNAKINLSNKNGKIHLLIWDDGEGFDYEKETARPGHYGLLGIRERIRLAGGRLKIDSHIGKGTTVYISIPVGEN